MRIERQDSDLRKQIWGFHAFDQKLILNTYHVEYRESKRHGWKVQSGSRYNRLSGRESDMDEQNVTIPPDVKEEAKQKLINQIEVLKWSEYKRV